MKQWYMLTVVGKDRPGIVAGLSSALYQAGANLGEASMVRLGGNFTIMLMVEAGADEAAFQQQLENFARPMLLHVHLDRIEGHLHQHLEPNVEITVHGADRPGIVAQVTSALSAAGFSILDLDSDVGGTDDRPIYIMVMDGHVPGGVPALASALDAVRQSGIEIRATPVQTLVG
jgi:glycine cleavage system transcriptional repressor